MNTDIIVSATLNGGPLRLSNGTKIVGEGITSFPVILVDSGLWGNLEFEVRNMDPGPADPLWVGARFRGPHPGDIRAFEEWEAAPCLTYPFHKLSTPEVFWSPAKAGTHMLRGPDNKLVRVSPVAPELRGHFWTTIQRVMDKHPKALFGPKEIEEHVAANYWGHEAANLWRERLGDTDVWFCMSPAPVTEPGWFYTGPSSVRISHGSTLGVWEPLFKEVLAWEQSLGRDLAGIGG